MPETCDGFKVVRFIEIQSLDINSRRPPSQTLGLWFRLGLEVVIGFYGLVGKGALAVCLRT